MLFFVAQTCTYNTQHHAQKRYPPTAPCSKTGISPFSTRLTRDHTIVCACAGATMCRCVNPVSSRHLRSYRTRCLGTRCPGWSSLQCCAYQDEVLSKTTSGETECQHGCQHSKAMPRGQNAMTTESYRGVSCQRKLRIEGYSHYWCVRPGAARSMFAACCRRRVGLWIRQFGSLSLRAN